MDSDRFDILTRMLSSRRLTLTGLLGGLTALLALRSGEDAAAHDPIPACRKIDNPERRRDCLRRAR